MSAPGNARKGKATKVNWQTPPELFNLLDHQFRFTLDAAASAANHLCRRYLTAEEDALSVDVFDENVFCNPPYGGRANISWIDAFARWSADGGCTVAAILPNATDTQWYARMSRTAYEIRLLDARVPFIDPEDPEGDSGNTGGTVAAIWYPGKRTAPMPMTYVWHWKTAAAILAQSS